MFDNELIASTADIIFLCCLPYQLDNVIPELQKSLQKRLRSGGRPPMIISILAGMGAPKIAHELKKAPGGFSFNAIITTKINVKRLKAALSKDSESVGRAKMSESLGRIYKKISKPFPDNKELKRTDSSSEDIDPNQDDVVIGNFIKQEAAVGLTFKRGEEIINWISAYNSALPDVDKKIIITEIFGKEYSNKSFEDLMT